MPAFPTMDKEQVKLRVSLRAYKNEDFDEVMEGQTAMPGAERDLKEAVVAARLAEREGKIRDPYVKIGVVKRSLVFRIKHNKGHWGDDDLVLVKVYVEPTRDDEIAPTKKSVLGDTGVLKKKAGKPVLTVAWWNAARGSFNDQALSDAMPPLELAINRIAAAPSLERYIDAVDAVNTARRAAVLLSKRMTVSDDKKIMVKLVEALSDARGRLETEQEEYLKRLRQGESDILVFLEDMADNPERNIKTLQDAIERREPLDKLLRDYARITPQLERSSDLEFKDVLHQLAVKAESYKLNVEDFDPADFRQPFNLVMRRIREASLTLDELEVQLNDLEPEIQRAVVVEAPPQTMNLPKLNQAWAGYLDVYAISKNTTRLLGEVIRHVAGLGDLDGDPLYNRIDELLGTVIETREECKAAVAKMRNAQGVYTKMKVEAGVSKEIDERQFIPMTNLIIAEGSRQRRMLSTLKRQLPEHVLRLPEGRQAAATELVTSSIKLAS